MLFSPIDLHLSIKARKKNSLLILSDSGFNLPNNSKIATSFLLKTEVRSQCLKKKKECK